MLDDTVELFNHDSSGSSNPRVRETLILSTIQATGFCITVLPGPAHRSRSFASSPSAAAVVSNSQSIINAKECSEEASSRLVAACAVNTRALERTIAQPLRFCGYELCCFWHFPGTQYFSFSLGPIVKFESIRPAALFIAFVSPATDCVFHLNGCCRELFGCFKGLNLSVASHQNGAASWTCKCMVRKQVGPC